MHSVSKFDLRRQYRDIRARIPSAYREEAALSAANNFSHQSIFKESHRFACYLAGKGEFNAEPILDLIWRNKKLCYLPVLTDDDKKSLIFVLYEYGDALHRNRYSILEPIDLSREISPDLLDIVITPLIAYDLRGHRLGTGGGYYDRTFAFLQNKEQRQPQMIGLAYAAQQAKRLPSDPWDISLDGVINEKTFISF